jgi:HEPN domain-containing protein
MSDDRSRDAVAWLDFALDDLVAARSKPGRHLRPRHVANLAQQAAEKALKAAIVLAGDTPPKTHDLEHLRSLLPAGWRSKRRPPDLERLSAFGVSARYPDHTVQVTPLDSATAVRQANAVMRAVLDDFVRDGIAIGRIGSDERGPSDG